MTALALELRKARAVFSVYLQDGLAYRASGLIWITTELATAITMPLLWARAESNGSIGGYTTSDFVLYYLCTLLLQGFITSHILWEISLEVKEGLFSAHLLRPYSYFKFSFLRNLPWRLIRPALFLPFFLILLVAYRPMLGDARVYLGWEVWIAVFLGHVLSFTFVLMMGMIALYTQEASAIFELYYIPMLFLSGALFPIALLPDWAQTAARSLPFYFTTGAPTELLVGRLPASQAPQVLLGQVAWIALSYMGFRLLWRSGLKRYTGVGL